MRIDFVEQILVENACKSVLKKRDGANASCTPEREFETALGSVELFLQKRSCHKLSDINKNTTEVYCLLLVRVSQAPFLTGFFVTQLPLTQATARQRQHGSGCSEAEIPEVAS